jgi:histidinol-phosphatase (PHP family)
MIAEECPDVVGHIDKIKIQDEEGRLFSQQALWYKQEMRQTLLLIADAGAIIEVNTRGFIRRKHRNLPRRVGAGRNYRLGIPITLIRCPSSG